MYSCKKALIEYVNGDSVKAQVSLHLNSHCALVMYKVAYIHNFLSSYSP